MTPHCTLLAAATLTSLATVWGCGGCTGGEGVVLDARPPDAPVVHRDLLSRDTRRPPDNTVDPDVLPACNTSRTLTPKPVTRGSGVPCGAGCRQVTFGGDVNTFDVNGDLLVYTAGGGTDRDIYLVNLKSNKEWILRNYAPGQRGCFNVATDGHRVVYHCSQSHETTWFFETFHSYDPSTAVEHDLTCLYLDGNKSSAPRYMALSSAGMVVTMSKFSLQGSDAWLLRWDERSFTNISKRGRGVAWSRAKGTRVVWTQVMMLLGESGYTQIYLYDTQTNAVRAVAPHAAPQFRGRVNGDKVVWVDHRNAPGDLWNQGNSDIYLHDLKSGKTTAVSTHTAQQDEPDVEGDLVVWKDWRNNPGTTTPRYTSEMKRCDVFLRDLSSGKEEQLTDFDKAEVPTKGLYPRIDQRRVFYRGVIAQKGCAVFMIDLDKRPASSPGASQRSK